MMMHRATDTLHCGRGMTLMTKECASLPTANGFCRDT